MDVPVNNIYTFEAMFSNSDKPETEDVAIQETFCLFLPHHPIEDDITPHCDSESLQLKEEPLSNGCDNYDDVNDPLAIEEILIKSEDHVIKNEAENESLQMREEPLCNGYDNYNEVTNPLEIVRTELIENETVTIDEGAIKGNIKNCINCKRSVKEKSSEYMADNEPSTSRGPEPKKRRSAEPKRVYTEEEIQKIIDHIHLPQNLPKNAKNETMRKRCKECSATLKIRKETVFGCPSCPGFPGLCLDPCFRLYHKYK
ncbi:uncharacterized protein LOC142333644 isoform X3 [Lycorma delicatula]|uniref:uncharacterized protein LOC142333644 isoform X3 n=1 Tax=Lycorma delicatula TaxID=130591 RepID=UPI003F51129D